MKGVSNSLLIPLGVFVLERGVSTGRRGSTRGVLPVRPV